MKDAQTDKVVWLVDQMFTAFPKDVTGLKFCILDCRCIYCQRVFRDGNLDPQIGIYRDAEDGPCEICLAQTKTWEDRVINENVVCHSKLHTETV